VRGAARRNGPTERRDRAAGRLHNLSENQQVKLAWIAATDPRLYRAYLLKEGLRIIFSMPYKDAVEALEKWIG